MIPEYEIIFWKLVWRLMYEPEHLVDEAIAADFG